MLMNRIGASIFVFAILLAGCRSGKIATIDFSDGSYQGEIDKEGRKDGKGTYRWNDGSSYEGDFKENDRHGLGTFLWNNGESYKGDYFKDERTGEGAYSWPDGSTYRGSFLNGKRHGKGIFVSPDGSVYKGDWFDDLQHGEGILTRANGTTVEGVWRMGKLVTPPSDLPGKADKPNVRMGWKESARSKQTTPPPIDPAPQPVTPQGTVKITVTPSPSVNNLGNQMPASTESNGKSRTWFPQVQEEKTVETPPAENTVVQPASPPSATIKGSDDDSIDWEGNRMEAELKFVTYLIDGIDTIFHKQSKVPFTGKMRVLDPSGLAIGELEVLNGRMHGEEVFFDPNGNVSATQVWFQGKRTK